MAKQISELKTARLEQDNKLAVADAQEQKDMAYIRYLEKSLKHEQFELRRLTTQQSRFMECL